jgi:hypothetical protein
MAVQLPHRLDLVRGLVGDGLPGGRRRLRQTRVRRSATTPTSTTAGSLAAVVEVDDATVTSSHSIEARRSAPTGIVIALHAA